MILYLLMIYGLHLREVFVKALTTLIFRQITLLYWTASSVTVHCQIVSLAILLILMHPLNLSDHLPISLTIDSPNVSSTLQQQVFPTKTNWHASIDFSALSHYISGCCVSND